MGTTQKNIKDEDKKNPVYQQTKLGFGVSPQDASLSAQAQWYVYSNHIREGKSPDMIKKLCIFY
jgi:hypothetical protein